MSTTFAVKVPSVRAYEDGEEVEVEVEVAWVVYLMVKHD